jgi:hypothetical protein
VCLVSLVNERVVKALSVDELDLGLALRRGVFDSNALLLLRCLRRSFFPMLWIGLAAAVVSGRQELVGDVTSLADIYGQFETTGDLIRALFSPLAPLILAVAIRVAVSFLALALAYPLTRWTDLASYSTSRRPSGVRRMWVDRLNLTRAYRSLRWTWAARDVAIRRAGNAGRRLATFERVLGWANVSLFIGMMMAISLTPLHG